MMQPRGMQKLSPDLVSRKAALSHPVVVIRTLGKSYKEVWVCLVSDVVTRARPEANRDKITGSFKPGYMPISEPKSTTINNICDACETDHTVENTDEVLTLVEQHVPGKRSHVAARKVYEVSLKMLAFERERFRVGDYKLDEQSKTVSCKTEPVGH